MADGISRIKGLTIQNFRGWASPKAGPAAALDTDADLVLLVGANGLGKTSLLEALVLILDGHRVHRPPTGDPSGGDGDRLGDLVHRGRDAFQIEVRTGDGFAQILQCSKDDVALRHGRDGDTPEVNPGSYWKHVLAKTAQDGRVPTGLLASATSFFQEDIRQILDDLARAQTLSEWFRPLHPAGRKLLDQLEREADRMKGEASRLEGSIQEDEAVQPAFILAAREFAHEWEKWRETRPDLPAVPVKTLHQPEAMITLLNDMERHVWTAASRRGTKPPSHPLDYPPDELLDRLKERLTEAALGSDQQSRLDELRQELAKIEQQLGQLRQDLPSEAGARVQAWADAVPPDLPALELILRSLRQNLDRWRDTIPHLPEPARLARLQQELESLDEGTLGALSAELEAYVGPWRRAAAQERTLRERQRALELERAELERLAPEEVLDALSRWRGHARAERDRRARHTRATQRRARLAHLHALEAALIDLKGRLDRALKTQTDTEAWRKVEDTLHEVLDRTLFRFQLDPGVLPIHPHEQDMDREGKKHQGIILRTADQRTWADLSTGQKGQLALGFMLAQALVLGPSLPHRVLMLDDTSTAFDLGNLARQATWLRQLAYNPDPKQRWQIFLASHHEEMTARMVEALRPPPDREVRFVQFNGWTAQEGPEIALSKLIAKEPPRILHKPLPDRHERVSAALRLVWHEPRDERETARKT